MDTIYADIAARTDGNIYIGVSGPVRTGKSTLIKRIMEQLVIPNIQDPYRRERAKDELPQCGSGKTIMTGEPKFVPEEAVELSPDGTATLRIRMIDSVGYMVDGAVGAEEDGAPRMVTTPWFDYEIPMTEAAELGTKKVMQEHCPIGLVVTTDGTVTDSPRKDYIEAERRAITDMQATGKPFLVVINTREPKGEAARQLQQQLASEYGISPIVADCQSLEPEELCQMLRALLYAFPLGQLQVHLPRWMDSLPASHPIKAQLYPALLESAQSIRQLGQAADALDRLKDLEHVTDVQTQQVDLATGTVICRICFPDALFYRVLSQQVGLPIENDAALMNTLTQLAAAKAEYDKLSDALASVKATGYGIVMPTGSEMRLEKPELLRKNGACGVKLRAAAPSIHMLRVDVDTEISPMVGDEKQSKELIDFLLGEEPERLWESNIFGKSVYAMLQEGLSAKLHRTPPDVQAKFRGSLSRIVNEGATGLICLIL